MLRVLLLPVVCWLVGCVDSAWAQSVGLVYTHDEIEAQAPNFIEGWRSNVSLVNSDLQFSTNSIQNLRITHSSDVDVDLEWIYDVSLSRLRTPRAFIVELAQGRYNEDFGAIDRLDVDLGTLKGSHIVQTYTLANLSPLSWYRLRVVPIFSSGPDLPSMPIVIKTLRSAINYWEPILPRRFSKLAFGRGFSDPVVDSPHLSPGVEIHANEARDEENPLWFADSPTRETPLKPSGRRGHTLTLIDDRVFLFGGRTNGYSCASTVKDTIDRGMYDSGRSIYPCVSMQAEVSEVWTFDISTFEWQFINTTYFDYMNPYLNDSRRSPPSREQHSAALMGGNLFVFGGKSRHHQVDFLGQPVLENKTDVAYNDLWMLVVEHNRSASFHWTNASIDYRTDLHDDIFGLGTYHSLFNHSASLPPSTRIDPLTRNSFVIDTKSIVNHRMNSHNRSEGDSPRYGQCIRDVTVRVKVRHPCATQLRMSIIGPRPSSGSPNYFSTEHTMEVRLLNAVLSNSTNCIGGTHEFAFNDAFLDDPNIVARESVSGEFAPAGKLSEFLDASHASQWTLIVEDVKNDLLSGHIVDWHLEFVTAPCFPSNYWVAISAPGAAHAPAARYHANMVSHATSLFVFGGRDQNDSPLHDLLRFDWSSRLWTPLKPVGFFSSALSPAESMGASLALTPQGLVLFGGYYRQRYLSAIYDTSDFQRNNRDDFLYRRAEAETAQYYNKFTNQDGASNLERKAQGGHVYDNNVLTMDLVTQRWSAVNITSLDNPYVQNMFSFDLLADRVDNAIFDMYQNTFYQELANKQPAGRYLSATVFIPSTALSWRTVYRDKNLYDTDKASYQANYQGSVADSLLVFGGFDAATGSTSDGSSGGFLEDSWLLRLNTESTAKAKSAAAEYHRKHCSWRLNPSAQAHFQTVSCLSGTSMTNCQFRDLMLLLWCAGETQSL